MFYRKDRRVDFYMKHLVAKCKNPILTKLCFYGLSSKKGTKYVSSSIKEETTLMANYTSCRKLPWVEGDE